MTENWKNDIALINSIFTGGKSNTWKSDFLSISHYSGGTPINWRNAIMSWALSRGITANNWRDALIGISNAVDSATSARTWKEALRFIRLYYEDNPPEPPKPLRLYDSAGRALYDSLDRALYVRS